MDGVRKKIDFRIRKKKKQPKQKNQKPNDEKMMNENTHLIPWVEKHRPRTIKDIAHQDQVVSALGNAVESGNIPHLLFYGPPGTGKTSSILAVARDMFGKHFRDRVLELNASDERGISIVREKIKMFASTQVSSGTVRGKSMPPFKLIILDEADSMTEDAQSALRRTMELYTNVTRFCLICNYVSRIIDPLSSRCAKFRFQPLSEESFQDKIKSVCKLENLTLAPGTMDTLVNVSKGDMRMGINTLQSASQYNEGEITPDAILETAGLPSLEILDTIWKAIESKKFSVMLKCTQDIIAEGYALNTVLHMMQEQVLEKGEYSDKVKAEILYHIAKIDKACIDGANEELQLQKLLSVSAQAF